MAKDKLAEVMKAISTYSRAHRLFRDEEFVALMKAGFKTAGRMNPKTGATIILFAPDSDTAVQAKVVSWQERMLTDIEELGYPGVIRTQLQVSEQTLRQYLIVEV